MSTMGAKVQWMPTAAGLARRHRLAAGRQVRVPARRQPERDREDGPKAVDHVEAEQQRDLQPRGVQVPALPGVGLRRLADEQQRSGDAGVHRRLHDPGLGPEPLHPFRVGAEAEVLAQLAGLLLQRHLRQQPLGPRLDPALGARPGVGLHAGQNRTSTATPTMRWAVSERIWL
jgi:hypothetical protein